MMPWRPSNDFEEEIISLQPECNFIYGDLSTEPTVHYPRPQSHLNLLKKKGKQPETATPAAENAKLNIIAEVQKIAGTKPLGQHATINDWDNDDNIERETIAMMRHFGMGPSLDESLTPECTLATHPITEKVQITRNGRRRFPVLLDEKYFKLQPRDTSPIDYMAEINDNDNSLLSLPSSKSGSSFSSSTEDSNEQKNKNCAVKYTNLQNSNISDKTPSTSAGTEQISTRVWYRSDYNQKKNKNNNRALKINTEPEQQRFYTAKELYDKKRRNKNENN